MHACACNFSNKCGSKTASSDEDSSDEDSSDDEGFLHVDGMCVLCVFVSVCVCVCI